ncbi:hypothetical protein ABW20_dc0110167 [Dactylellina cionopaga]|nr:hypothetical protein ABW20_dc0110167 [Dactylellina cionopaga]
MSTAASSSPPFRSDKNLSDLNLPEVVKTFNSLSRSLALPSGIPSNIWHFTVRHIPLQPPGDVLFLVNTSSRFIHTEGPITYHSTSLSPTPNSFSTPYSSPSLQAKAKAIVPLLLHSFNNRFNISDQQVGAFAPWKWMTNDPEFARLVGEELRAAGVSAEDLCNVVAGTTQENEEAQENWCRFVGALTKMVKKGVSSP